MDSNILNCWSIISIGMNSDTSNKEFTKFLIVLISIVGTIMFLIHLAGNKNEANPVKTSIIETFGLDDSSRFMEKYGD